MGDHVAFKVGDSIPLGELDDKLLIETWDLALQEYNCFYSIDPAIRKQGSQSLESSSGKVSLGNVNNTPISSSTKKRKREGQHKAIMLNGIDKDLNEIDKDFNEIMDTCAEYLHETQKADFESEDLIITEDHVQFKEQDQISNSDFGQGKKDPVISSQMISQVLFPKRNDPLCSSYECIKSSTDSTELSSPLNTGDTESLIKNIAMAYEKGYHYYRENQIIDNKIIEAKASEIFAKSPLLQSWFKTGAITAISFL